MAEFAVIGLGGLLKVTGRFGETIESDRSTRALEPVPQFSKMVHVIRVEGRVHFVYLICQLGYERLNDFAKLRPLYRQSGLNRRVVEVFRLRLFDVDRFGS